MRHLLRHTFIFIYTLQITKQGECDKLMRVVGCVKNTATAVKKPAVKAFTDSLRLTEEVSEWILASEELPEHLVWAAECKAEFWEVVGKSATTRAFEK